MASLSNVRRQNLYAVLLIIVFNVSSTMIFGYYLLTATSVNLCEEYHEEPRPLVLNASQPVKTNLELERDHFLLVVLVLSRPSGKERRDSIRQTWMKREGKVTHSVFVKFSIGTEGVSTEDMDKLMLEQSIYGDLLLLSYLKDSYDNLTRKVLQSFMALNYLFSFSYLLKCDDDTFVVMDTILSELAQRKSKRSYYWGEMFQSTPILRRGKWAEKNWFLCDTYIPYASGGGYVLSRDLVSYITANSDALMMYHNEDVSVGVWVGPYDMDRHHDIRFNVHVIDVKCNSSNIVLHYQTLQDMPIRQSSFDKYGVIC